MRHVRNAARCSRYGQPAILDGQDDTGGQLCFGCWGRGCLSMSLQLEGTSDCEINGTQCDSARPSTAMDPEHDASKVVSSTGYRPAVIEFDLFLGPCGTPKVSVSKLSPKDDALPQPSWEDILGQQPPMPLDDDCAAVAFFSCHGCSWWVDPVGRLQATSTFARR